MIFDVSCELEYAVSFPSTLILSVHAQRDSAQTVITEHFSIAPNVKFSEFVAETSGNRFVRVLTGRHKRIAIHYKASVDCDFQLLTGRKLEATPVSDLSAAELQYLFPSRYCQSDRLGRLAWDLFG